jgi:hypothetical protein
MVLDLSNETSLLELLEAVSDHFTSTLVVLGGANAASLLATVVSLQSRHTNLSSDIELIGDGSGSDVQPVAVVWSEILVTSSLNVLGPLHNKNTTITSVSQLR